MNLEFSAVSNFDYLVAIIIFISALLAFAKGFVKTSISFLGWIAIFTISVNIYPFVGKYLHSHVNSEHMLAIIAGLVSFISSVILVSIVTNQLNTLTKEICGGIMDHLLGLFFGLLRGCVVVSLMFWVIVCVSAFMDSGSIVSKDDPNYAEKILPLWLTQAKSYTIVKRTTHYFGSFVPSGLQDKITATISSSMAQSTDYVISNLAQKSIEHVLAALPNEMTKDLDSATLSKVLSADLSAQDKHDLISKLLGRYTLALESGKIDEKKRVSKEEIHELQQLLRSLQEDKKSTVTPIKLPVI
ncbi:MAG: hypothetical protein RIT35_233 [Pseudomonadota bacterium]|jgi:uncharacterized membrane protein required for colicin V production